jgi:hypothetical protein
LNKPLEPLKKDVSAIIKYDSSQIPMLSYIFLDQSKDKKKGGKYMAKMLYLYLFVNKD